MSAMQLYAIRLPHRLVHHAWFEHKEDPRQLSACTPGPQVVVGVLGCPNLPQARISDADGAGNSAERAGTQGVGVLFAARRGGGAHAGPLEGARCTFAWRRRAPCVTP